MTTITKAMSVNQSKPEERPREVQCADCQRRIDADKPHTCKQQVKRNKRGLK